MLVNSFQNALRITNVELKFYTNCLFSGTLKGENDLVFKYFVVTRYYKR